MHTELNHPFNKLHTYRPVRAQRIQRGFSQISIFIDSMLICLLFMTTRYWFRVLKAILSICSICSLSANHFTQSLSCCSTIHFVSTKGVLFYVNLAVALKHHVLHYILSIHQLQLCFTPLVLLNVCLFS